MSETLSLRCRMHTDDWMELKADQYVQGEFRLDVHEAGITNTIYLNKFDMEFIREYINSHL